jgi:phage repressor protein C with HTH and peptisase S24 domain
MQGDNLKYYSVADLLGLSMPGYPETRQGWDTLVKRDKWTFREMKGLGGPGGIKREYCPPPDVMALIEARKRSPAAHSVRESAAEYKPTPPEGFVLVPRYDVQGSMGNGSVIHSEQIVDHLAFRAEWVRTALGASPEHLVLISAIGDSMEPTLRAGDLLLIDRSVTGVKHDSIYAFAVGDELRVKRVQRLYDGTLIVKSDNPGYSSETLTPEQADKVNIVGRVVWTGRRM